MQVAWRGSHLGARLIRSTGWVAIGYAASQAIRLFSNLILTRILFPEAFGLMALITVFLVGLNMLSDIGVSPSIGNGGAKLGHGSGGIVSLRAE